MNIENELTHIIHKTKQETLNIIITERAYTINMLKKLFNNLTNYCSSIISQN